MIKITINTENAAFHNEYDPASDTFYKFSEVARILDKLAKRLDPEQGGDTPPIRLMDINGNCVGICEEVDD